MTPGHYSTEVIIRRYTGLQRTLNYSSGHLVLSNWGLAFVQMSRPFSPELVMFPVLEFRKSLGTYILLLYMSEEAKIKAIIRKWSFVWYLRISIWKDCWNLLTKRTTILLIINYILMEYMSQHFQSILIKTSKLPICKFDFSWCVNQIIGYI